MSLWFVIALMTAVAAFAVLWPLGRKASPRAEGDEAHVYRDQLAEVDRDAAAGLIGPAEAEAARIEISRRLLAAAEAPHDAPRPHPFARRAASLVALIGVPALALGFYLPLGSPQLPDAPLAARGRAPVADASLLDLIAKVEGHLEKNPTDGRGWNVLAPVLARLGRYADAVRAYRNAIAYGGETAEKRANLGEVIAGVAGGVVTADAKREFERALVLDAAEPKARYFIGLAASQDGRTAEAAAIWRKLLEEAPADAPWRLLVASSLARLAPESQVPEDVAKAAESASPQDRAALIQSMVDRLAARLKEDGRDADGWLRLVRAYIVLGERDKASAAAADARRALVGDAAQLKSLADGLKALGFEG